MARRRSDYYRDRDDYYDDRGDNRRSRSRSRSSGRRKSSGEEQIERLTWFLLVMVIALIHIVREGGMTLPNWSVPFSGCIVLLGSGMYQYSRRWRVSPTTWLAGALLGALALINLYVSPESSFLGLSLVVFAAVILVGLLTGET